MVMLGVNHVHDYVLGLIHAMRGGMFSWQSFAVCVVLMGEGSSRVISFYHKEKSALIATELAFGVSQFMAMY